LTFCLVKIKLLQGTNQSPPSKLQVVGFENNTYTHTYINVSNNYIKIRKRQTCIQGDPILLLIIKLSITWYNMHLYLW